MGSRKRQKPAAKAHARNVARGLIRRGCKKEVAYLIQQNIEGGYYTHCRYCKVQLSGSDVSIDHVLPLSRAGTSAYDNLSGCCGRCNRLKGALTAGEFLALRKVLQSFPEMASRSVERRMLAGGRIFGR